MPPPVETCVFSPEPLNGRTYTSMRPDSLDWYASQRPSGEKAAPHSSKGLAKKLVGVPGFHPDTSSPSRGKIMISPCSPYARALPDGCQDMGTSAFLLRASGATAPVPSV